MAEPRRLALVLPDLGGGGAERVGVTLANRWAACGYRVDMVLQKARGPLLTQLAPAVRVIDLDATRLRHVARPLARYFRQEQPAATLASMWPLTIAAILAHRLAGSPGRLVLAEHSSLSRQYAHLSGSRRLLLTEGTRIFYPLAQARVAVSSDAADDLARLAGLGRQTIRVIYNPVAPHRLPKAKAADVDALWGAGTGARILTVGRLGAEKNQALLIRAFARLAGNRRARLAIVGDGPLRSALAELAEREGVAGQVVFPGFIADPAPYYATADLFVLCSDFEGFGLVLVEAMAAGLPVVSTDCPSGPREILDGGRFGRLVPCGDAAALERAMAEALDTPGRPDLRIARAAEFSVERASALYLEAMLDTPAAA